MSGSPPKRYRQPCLFWPTCSCGDGSVACAMTPIARPDTSKGAPPSGVGALSGDDFYEDIPALEDDPAAILAPGQLPVASASGDDRAHYEESCEPEWFIFSITLIEVDHG